MESYLILAGFLAVLFASAMLPVLATRWAARRTASRYGTRTLRLSVLIGVVAGVGALLARNYGG